MSLCRPAFPAVCIFLTCLAACSSRPESLSSDALKNTLQAYFDHQPAVQAHIQFLGKDMVCQAAQGPSTCPKEVVSKLKMLVKVGLLDSREQSPGVTAYTITQEGRRYIRPLGVRGYYSDTQGSGNIIDYAVDEGRTVLTKIDSYTVPGPNSEGATATTVWFVVENRPYDWIKPYIAQESRTTHIGETQMGRARLVLTNKGWRVTEVGMNQPQF